MPSCAIETKPQENVAFMFKPKFAVASRFNDEPGIAYTLWNERFRSEEEAILWIKKMYPNSEELNMEWVVIEISNA